MGRRRHKTTLFGKFHASGQTIFQPDTIYAPYSRAL